MKVRFLLSFTVAALACTALGAQSEEFKTDEEGFIRNWLLLAPIACEAELNGAVEIDKEQVKGEGKIKPKAGEKCTVGGKELTWKSFKAADYFFDFNVFLEKKEQLLEDVIGYAVCYVCAADEIKDLQLRIGSNDQAKIYLNGKEVLKNTEAHPVDKDQDVAEKITLNKGKNVIVFKVINEKNNWQGCVRFTDKSEKPIKNIKVSLSPD